MATLQPSVIYAEIEASKDILNSLERNKEALVAQMRTMKELEERVAIGWAGVSGEAVLRQIQQMHKEHCEILNDLENKIEAMKKCICSIERKDQDLGRAFASINERGRL